MTKKTNTKTTKTKKTDTKKTDTKKTRTKQKPGNMEKIGSIAVESGMLWLSDPSQLIGAPGPKRLFVDWPDFLDKSGFSHADQAKHGRCMKAHREGKPITDDMRPPMAPEFRAHADNAGVSIRTPNGDGLYEVYATRDSSGVIDEIRILL